jgi:hypothetical protein
VNRRTEHAAMLATIRQAIDNPDTHTARRGTTGTVEPIVDWQARAVLVALSDRPDPPDPPGVPLCGCGRVRGWTRLIRGLPCEACAIDTARDTAGVNRA